MQAFVVEGIAYRTAENWGASRNTKDSAIDGNHEPYPDLE